MKIIFPQIKIKENEMKKILMSVLALSTLVVVANAGCTGTICSNVKITKLYMTAGGTLYVGTNGKESSLSCKSPAGKYVSLAEGDVGKNAMYSLLLTSMTTNKKVSIKVISGSPTCKVQYITAN